MSLFRAFFGNADEMSLLLRTVREARAQSTGKVVLVEGDAGIGKTRLISELRAALRAERVAFLVGRSAEYLRAPYEPFVDALRTVPEASAIEDALRAAPAVGRSSEEDRAARFRLVERLLRNRIAARGSLVLAIEDLHWTDGASLDLLRHLSHRFDDAPAVLVATYRASDAALQPRVAATLERLRREGATRLALRPWSDALLAGAIRDSVPPSQALSEAQIRNVSRLAEGNPFIAEELASDALEAAAAGTPAHLPLRSVARHIKARLTALSATDQQVLMYAAAVGRDFDAGFLARLTGNAVEVVASSIRAAMHAQLVSEDHERGHISFRHALTREIIYGELLATELVEIHQRIAQALEESDAEVPIESLAFHWWAARDTGRATTANILAGDRAAELGAPADAASFYERALDFAPLGSTERNGLLGKVVQAHHAANDARSCLVWCRKASEELELAGACDEGRRFSLRAAHQQFALGDLAGAKATIRRVQAAARDDAGSPTYASSELSLAMVLVAEGNARDALIALERACASTTLAGREAFRRANIAANAFAALGRSADSLLSYQQALLIAIEEGDTELEILARNNLGVSAVAAGDVHTARATYAAALAVAEQRGHEGDRNMIAANMAQCLLLSGDLNGARSMAGIARNREPASSPRAVLGDCITLAADDLSATGRTKDRRWIDDLIVRAVATHSPELAALADGIGALALVARDAQSAARDITATGIARAASLESVYWLIEAVARLGGDGDVSRARALLASGQSAGANTAVTANASWFEALLAQRTARMADARAHAAAAQRGFAQMGWLLHAAAALEVAGDPAGALAGYRACGAAREVRRIEDSLGRKRTRTRNDLGLSKRQEDVARLVVRGYSNQTVAAELGIGERTVETHVAALFRKLGVGSRTELVARLGAGP